MNKRQMQYVLAVSEARSFSEAASMLMVSQPSISQYVSKLEEEIGVQIFERSVPLKLTYAGELYVKTARKILKEEEELEERLRDLRGEMSGKIKIGSGFLNVVSMLPGLIALFRESFPNAQVEIVEDTEPNLKYLVDEGKLDIVVATNRFDNAAYERMLLCEEDYIFAVPKHFGKVIKDEAEDNSEFHTLDITALEKIPIIRLQPNTFMRELIDSLYDTNHIKPISTIDCTTALAAYNMVKAGVGATIISYSTYKMDHSDSVYYCTVKEINQKRQIFFVYNKAKYLSDLTKEFIRIGQDYYKK